MGALKTIFSLGVIGTAATLGGTVLLPFLGSSAGQMMALGGATNGQILTSFWSPLFTDTAGELSLGGAFSKMGGGFWELGGAATDVIGAGISAGTGADPIWGSMVDAWNSPA